MTDGKRTSLESELWAILEAELQGARARAEEKRPRLLPILEVALPTIEKPQYDEKKSLLNAYINDIVNEGTGPSIPYDKARALAHELGPKYVKALEATVYAIVSI